MLGQVKQPPWIWGGRAFLDFTSWKSDERGYTETLNRLIKLIQGSTDETQRDASALAQKRLPRQLSLVPAADWPFGSTFKGKVPFDDFYVDGSNRIWIFKRGRLQCLAKR